MTTFFETFGEHPEIGDIWRHIAIQGLDCTSGSWDSELVSRGPFLYTAPAGWQLMESRFVETHKRGDSGVLEWRMMAKGTNIVTSSSLDSSHSSALDLLAKLLSESNASEEKKEKTEKELKFQLIDKYRNILNTASAAAASVDSVEFRIFARGLGRLSGSRSRIIGHLEVAERFIGTPESTEAELKNLVVNGIQRLLS